MAILLVVASLFVSCKDTLESAGKDVGVRFPASAKVIGISRDKENRLSVKVEMPAADWPGFLVSTRIDSKSFRPDAVGLGLDDGFWDPNAHTKNMHSLQTDIPSKRGYDHRVLNIGYDDSRGSVVVVYVYCWEYN